MTIPEKIILDIWEFIAQNYGVTCGIVCIFFVLHLLWWERCCVFWRAVWSAISAIVRWTLWPVCYLYRKAQMSWKAWKEHRKERHIIAEFDRLHPELKDKYTDYGKLQFMKLAQDPTFQRINKLAMERAAKDPTKSLLQHFDDIATEEASKPIRFSWPN